MGSVDRRLRREFDAHVNSMMTPGAKQMAFAADPQWKQKAFADWRFNREMEHCHHVEDPTPPHLSQEALLFEMRDILEFCQVFLEAFEDDPDQEGVSETLERIRALPL